MARRPPARHCGRRRVRRARGGLIESGPVERGSARTGRMRQIISWVLGVLGALLVLLGGFAFYAREQIFDADAFAANAGQALDDQRVQDALDPPLTDAIVEQGKGELINARPVVEAAVGGITSSAPFRAVFEEAVGRVHRVLFTREGNDVVLNLADAGTLVVDAVKTLAPRVAKKLPHGLEGGLVELSDSKVLLDTVRVSEGVRWLGIVLPLLGLLSLAGSIALADDRRRGFVRAAISVAGVSALALILLLVGRSLVISQFADDTLADAAAAVWDAYLGGLRDWCLGVGVGALIVASAALTGRPLEVAGFARRLVAAAVATPRRPVLRAARALVLLALGLFAVLRPELALQALMVLVGAVAIFIAVTELLAMIAPPPAERPRRPSISVRLRDAAPILAAGALIAGIVLVVVLASGGEEGRPAGPVETCNGYAELCDRPLNEVAIPASHNSMSAAREPGWYIPNNITGIPQQLDSGVRGLLIDAHYGIKRESGPVLTDLKYEGRNKVLDAVRDELGPDAERQVVRVTERFATRGGEGEQSVYLCHTACELGSTNMTSALSGVRAFLDTHPDEFLVIFIEDYVKPKDIERVFTDSGLVDYAYTPELGEPFPTLRELIESDRRVLVMAENDNGDGSIPWYVDGFELAQETPFDFKSVSELEDHRRSCEPNRGQDDGPLFQVNNWIERIPVERALGARANAYDVLFPRLRACRRIRDLDPNIVGVDFSEEGDLFEATRRINGLPRDEEPSVRQSG
jgi:hypothetical protein